MKKACFSHWFIHTSFSFKMKLSFGILSPCLTHRAVGKYVPASCILWLWVETQWHNCLADSWPSISHTLKSPSEISRSGKSLGWDSLLGNQSPCLKWSQRASLSFYSICGHLNGITPSSDLSRLRSISSAFDIFIRTYTDRFLRS